MSTLIGLYDDYTQAERVEDALGKSDVSANNVWVENHKEFLDSDKRFSNADLYAELQERGIPQTEAEFYAEGVRRGGTLLIADVDGDVSEAQRVMSQFDPVAMEERRKAWENDGWTGYEGRSNDYSQAKATAGTTLKEVKEELHVGKREVETGTVTVEKNVTETPVEETVSLRAEHVEVERNPVNRTLSASEADAAFQEETIEMTETAEEVVVEKEARVTSEVVVNKTVDQHTETVRDTVREVEVDVKEMAGTSNEQYNTLGTNFRAHCENELKADYDTYEPAYQYGYALGSNDRYKDHDYDTLENSVRDRYNQQYGEGSYDEYAGNALRHAFNSARTNR